MKVQLLRFIKPFHGGYPPPTGSRSSPRRDHLRHHFHAHSLTLSLSHPPQACSSSGWTLSPCCWRRWSRWRWATWRTTSWTCLRRTPLPPPPPPATASSQSLSSLGTLGSQPGHRGSTFKALWWNQKRAFKLPFKSTFTLPQTYIYIALNVHLQR